MSVHTLWKTFTGSILVRPDLFLTYRAKVETKCSAQADAFGKVEREFCREKLERSDLIRARVGQTLGTKGMLGFTEWLHTGFFLL